jgi:hypothetical protein
MAMAAVSDSVLQPMGSAAPQASCENIYGYISGQRAHSESRRFAGRPDETSSMHRGALLPRASRDQERQCAHPAPLKVAQ